MIKIKILILFICMPIGLFSINKKILVTETTVKLSSLESKELFFGFAEGDIIVFNFELEKGKELKEVEIFEYPQSSMFMEYETKSIKNKEIKVNNEGIFKFKFRNSSIWSSRVAKIKIERIPDHIEKNDFNTTVYWRELTDTSYYNVNEKYLDTTEYITKTLINQESMIKKSSKTIIPIELPENTIEWYYQFAAFRNNADLDQVRNSYNLVGNLSRIVDITGVTSGIIKSLQPPPGGNVCNIYLLNKVEYTKFNYGKNWKYYETASRKNLKSGIIPVNYNDEDKYYLIIINPDNNYPINLNMQVATIIKNEIWKTKDVEKIKVKKWKEPYLEN